MRVHSPFLRMEGVVEFKLSTEATEKLCLTIRRYLHNYMKRKL